MVEAAAHAIEHGTFPRSRRCHGHMPAFPGKRVPGAGDRNEPADPKTGAGTEHADGCLSQWRPATDRSALARFEMRYRGCNGREIVDNDEPVDREMSAQPTDRE